MIEKGYFENHLELANRCFDTIKDTIPEKVLKTYNVGNAYFEDCFMRATKIYILNKYYERNNSDSKKRISVKESLQKQVKEYGFRHVELFYDELIKNSESPVIDIYINVLRSLMY